MTECVGLDVDKIQAAVDKASAVLADNPARGSSLGAIISIAESLTIYYNELGFVDDAIAIAASNALRLYKQQVSAFVAVLDAVNDSYSNYVPPEFPDPPSTPVPVQPEVLTMTTAAKVPGVERLQLDTSLQASLRAFVASLVYLIRVPSLRTVKAVAALGLQIFVNQQAALAYIGLDSHFLTRLNELELLRSRDLPYDHHAQNYDKSYTEDWKRRVDRVEYASATYAMTNANYRLGYVPGDDGLPMQWKTLPNSPASKYDLQLRNQAADLVYVNGAAWVVQWLSTIAGILTLLTLIDAYWNDYSPERKNGFIKANGVATLDTWYKELNGLNMNQQNIRARLNRNSSVRENEFKDDLLEGITGAYNQWVSALTENNIDEKVRLLNIAIGNMQIMEDALYEFYRAPGNAQRLNDMFEVGYTAGNNRAGQDAVDLITKQHTVKRTARVQYDELRRGVDTLSALILQDEHDKAFEKTTRYKSPVRQRPAEQQAPPPRGRRARSPARRGGTGASTVDAIVDQFLACRMGK